MNTSRCKNLGQTIIAAVAIALAAPLAAQDQGAGLDEQIREQGADARAAILDELRIGLSGAAQQQAVLALPEIAPRFEWQGPVQRVSYPLSTLPETDHCITICFAEL